MVRLDAARAVIKKLWVNPAYRRGGLARALLAELLAHARTSGYVWAVLDTEREQLPQAYRLYRSLGFRECAPYGQVDYATPTFMELPLADDELPA